MRFLVTGGAGFIGSAVARMIFDESADAVVVLDKLTYSGNLDNLAPLANSERFSFVRGDIADRALVSAVLEQHRPNVILHLAAESHVDRSIDGPAEFVHTNLIGTFTLLEASRKYLSRLDPAARTRFRFVHVSTDEVFGTLGPTGAFVETTPYAPNSPYSATKAGSDHLVRAWVHTFGFPAIVTNCSNNYGPYQFPEKLIPLMILKALDEEPLPVYGDGMNVRDWLHVADHARALLRVAERGRIGETYNIGGRAERTNLSVVEEICDIVDEMRPAQERRARLITFVGDRPGHDRRYAIHCSKIETELGWRREHSFSSGLRATVGWYLEHRDWCERIRSGLYRGERLGLRVAAHDEAGGAGRA